MIHPLNLTSSSISCYFLDVCAFDLAIDCIRNYSHTFIYFRKYGIFFNGAICHRTHTHSRVRNGTFALHFHFLNQLFNHQFWEYLTFRIKFWFFNKFLFFFPLKKNNFSCVRNRPISRVNRVWVVKQYNKKDALHHHQLTTKSLKPYMNRECVCSQTRVKQVDWNYCYYHRHI